VSARELNQGIRGLSRGVKPKNRINSDFENCHEFVRFPAISPTCASAWASLVNLRHLCKLLSALSCSAAWFATLKPVLQCPITRKRTIYIARQFTPCNVGTCGAVGKAAEVGSTPHAVFRCPTDHRRNHSATEAMIRNIVCTYINPTRFSVYMRFERKSEFAEIGFEIKSCMKNTFLQLRKFFFILKSFKFMNLSSYVQRLLIAIYEHYLKLTQR